jgi:ABC-type transport system involved in cytochrome c biogenesis permease subunit
MDYLYYSVILFNVSTFGYLIAALVLTAGLAGKKQSLLSVFKVMAVIVVAAHTAALLCRWFQAGFDRPPWTNLYESLVFFTWGLGVVSTVVVLRYRTYFLTTILYPLAFAGLGLASLVPDKSITPLVPSLQSYWIKIHVVMASMAYPGFITAGAVSLAYLLKKETKIEKLNAGFSFVALFFLAVVGQGDVFLRGVYQIPQMFFQDGHWFKIPIDPEAKPVEWVKTTIPYAGKLFFGTTVCYLLNVGYCFGALKDPDNPIWDKMRKFFNVLGFAGFAALLGVIYYNIATRDDLSLGANSYEMAILCVVFGTQALFLLYGAFRRGVEDALPSAEWLDEFAYKVTLFAFPFMTLLLITGAIWAYSAWGRYWGWDPKETCALITWLIFAGYLHARKGMGAKGSWPAIISVVGAVSVFFTFLGANLILSGLHSYGAQ